MSRIADPRPAHLEPAFVLSDPDALYEVVDGEVVELESMGILASIVAHRIFVALLGFAHQRRLGTVVIETLVILNESGRLKRRPDVAFASTERWPLEKEFPPDGDWDVIPELVIEVISPRDTDRTIQQKLVDYFAFGVRQVWIFRPLNQSISIYDSPRAVRILGPDDELDGGDVLPGFRLPIAPLFRRTED